MLPSDDEEESALATYTLFAVSPAYAPRHVLLPVRIWEIIKCQGDRGRPGSWRTHCHPHHPSTLAVHIVAEIATRRRRCVYEAKLAGMVETHNALYFWADGSLRSVHTPRFCLSTYLRWLAKHYFSLPDGRGRTNSMMAQSPKPTSRATGGHSVTETSDEAEYKSFEP